MRNLMKLRTSLVATSALALILAACGGTDSASEPAPAPAPAPSESETEEVVEEEPVTLRWVNPLPEGTLEFEGGFLFVDMLREAAPWITVEYVGGPEVVAANDQIQALADNVMDMSLLVPGYMGGVIPGAPAMLLSPNDTPTDEREIGSYDAYNELFFNPIGVHYLGDTLTNVAFTIFLGDRGAEIDLNDPNFFEGMTIRGTTQYSAVVEPRGGAMVNMPFGEIYSSMERGVIDGYGGPSVGIVELGVGDVTKYRFIPNFKKNVVGMAFNKGVWDGLSEGTRAAIENTMLEAEARIVAHYDERVEAAEAVFAEIGIQDLVLEGAVLEGWQSDANEVGWAEIRELDPVAFEALQQLWYGEVRYGN